MKPEIRLPITLLGFSHAGNVTVAPIGISTGIRPQLARAGWAARCGCAAILFLAIGIALAQQGTPVRSDGGGSAIRSARLWGLASSKEFSNVNRDDARAALRVWFNIVARRRGFVLDSRMDIVDSTKEIRERLLSHSVDLVMLSVPEYLELESSRLLVPVLTHARGIQGGTLRSNVLLVKASSGATSLAALRGKNVLTFSRNGANSAMAWLDLLLNKERLGRAASFFASIKSSDKAQTCILHQGRLRGGRGESERGEGNESSVRAVEGARPVPSHGRKRDRHTSGSESVSEGAD
jgi:hypothetical protein